MIHSKEKSTEKLSLLSYSRPVIFVNTDTVPAEDSRISAKTLHNETEATLVHQVYGLYAC